MTRALARAGARRSLARVRHVTPVHPGDATGVVAAVYGPDNHDDRKILYEDPDLKFCILAHVYKGEKNSNPHDHGPSWAVYGQVERDFGMLAPPIALHSPAPVPLAASWSMLRESLLVPGLVDRLTKERVATAVSATNMCPYCVEVHGATVRGLSEGLLGDDPEVRAVAEWARDPVTAPPFPAEHAAELVGVTVTFHYLNRMVNIFLDDSPLPPRLPARARAGAGRAFGTVVAAMSTRPHEPGASLPLLDAAAPTEDLGWTRGNDVITAAFARAAAAVDAAAAEIVPPPVRDIVHSRLSTWDGKALGLGRAWLEDAVGGLPADQRPAGRLALLVAVASYQVDDAVIEEFRRGQPGDQPLLTIASWASLAAARRVGAAYR